MTQHNLNTREGRIAHAMQMLNISEEKAIDIVNMAEWAEENKELVMLNYINFTVQSGIEIPFPAYIIKAWEAKGRAMYAEQHK